LDCPHCGVTVVPGNRFCQRCRKRVVPVDGAAPVEPASSAPAPPPYREPRVPAFGAPVPEIRRPGVVTLLAVLNFVGGALMLALGVLVFLIPGSGEEADPIFKLLMGVVYGGFGVLYLAAGFGLWQLRNWGRILQIVISCVGLLGFPCGTLISVLILIYLLKPGVKVLFSGRTVDELTPEESAHLAQALQSSGGTVVIVAIVCLVGLVVMIGIIAAIAIPSLLRARISANESAAIGRLRTVLSSEVVYAEANSGFADKPECVKAPGTCIPGANAAAPGFLDQTILFDQQQSGYVLSFHPGPPAPDEALAQGNISPTSVQTFAVTAVPVQVGRTGRRSFCTDLSGRMCFFADGSMPQIEEGVCPARCTDLQ
jgi:type IV pilus assembly protein PilA